MRNYAGQFMKLEPDHYYAVWNGNCRVKVKVVRLREADGETLVDVLYSGMRRNTRGVPIAAFERSYEVAEDRYVGPPRIVI